MSLDPRLMWLIIGAVTIAWLVITIISALKPGVEVPPALNSVFLGVAGAAVAKLGADKAKTKKDDEKGGQ